MSMLLNLFNHHSKDGVMDLIINNSSNYLNQNAIDNLFSSYNGCNLKINNILLVNKLSEEVVLSHIRQFTMTIILNELDVFNRISIKKTYQHNKLEIDCMVEKLASENRIACFVYCSGMIGAKIKKILGRSKKSIFHNEENTHDFINSNFENTIGEALYEILRDNLSRIDFVKKSEKITGLLFNH